MTAIENQLPLTSVYHISVMEKVDGVKDLLDGLRSVLLSKFSLFANSVEELTARGKLGDDVPLVL